MAWASGRVWRKIVWASLAGLAAGCAGGPGDRLSGVAYSGDIDPTVPRPLFAQVPGPGHEPGLDPGEAPGGLPDAEPQVRDAVGMIGPAAAAAAPVPPVDMETLLPPAVPNRPAQAAGSADTAVAEPDMAEPDMAPPAAAPPAAAPEAGETSAVAPVEDDPFAIEGSVDEVLANAAGADRVEAEPPGRSDFRLNSGATSLTADEWAALAELSRRQARLGGTVRLVVYRPAPAGDSGDGPLERSRARAQAMADALVRLGVDPARIDIAEADAPAGDTELAGGASGAGPRVFLDRAGTSG